LVRLGPPQRLPLPPTLGRETACSPDGRVVAGWGPEGALVWHRDRPTELVRLKGHYDVRSVSVSPDGCWVATGSFFGTGAKVWDAATGALAADLVPTQSAVFVRFSPDGKWLATSSLSGVCRLWSVGSWRQGPSLGVTWRAGAFSPDGRVLAVETGQNTVRLVNPDTGKEYARLEDPNQDRASSFTFSPDATQLFVTGENQWLHVWDLRAIRAELAARGLDWGLPPYPPADRPADAAPPRVVVDLGDLAAQVDRQTALQHNNLAWRLATDRDAKIRDPERAVALAKKAVELAPDVATYWNTLGAAHYRAGNWKDAVAALDKSMELRNGGDSFDWFFLAMAHWQLGHKEEARKWFDKAVERMEKNRPSDEELRRFRAEAAELLGVKDKKN
jgi:hypothetical protein